MAFMLNWILSLVSRRERRILFKITEEVAHWHNYWNSFDNYNECDEDERVRIRIKSRDGFYTATDRLYSKVPEKNLVRKVNAIMERGKVYYEAVYKKI